MSTFTYEAVDARGKPVAGEVEANNEQDAVDKVRKQALLPTKVVPKKGEAGVGRTSTGGTKAATKGLNFALGLGGVSYKVLTTFTRQFSTLVDAGLPIVRSLDILANQQKPGLLKGTLEMVREDVEGGMQLSESMSKHPRVFDKLYVNMVRAGEAGSMS